MIVNGKVLTGPCSVFAKAEIKMILSSSWCMVNGNIDLTPDGLMESTFPDAEFHADMTSF
jgi:hypothetical protein